MSDTLIITDGRAGNLRQARALATVMGVQAVEAKAMLRSPWAQLAPRLTRMGALAQRPGSGIPMRPPWPRLAIGCGRQAAWATRWLRQQAGDATFCVQILNPRIDSRHWNLLIAPRHDEVKGSNILKPIGSLNPIDSAWLARARADFAFLGQLPQPRVVLLVGGPRRGVNFDSGLAEALAMSARQHAGKRGSVLLSVSERTPADFADALRQLLGDRIKHAWLGGDGINPYAGFLGWADRILVSPDSVNMLSEAAACGVAVHSLTGTDLPPRLAAFHAALRGGGWLRSLDSDAKAPPRPLRETRRIAEEVQRRMHTHFRQHAIMIK